MYQDFFSFSEAPFENNLDQRFLFLSQDHNEVLAALQYFIKENKAFALLCGDVGTGKTMLLNSFFEWLPANITPISIVTPIVEYHEILLCVARHVGVATEGKTVLELVVDVKRVLMEEEAAGRQFVLIIDEAHLLSAASLENIRLLSNIETQRHKLLQILLVGQYELSHKLNRPEMRQLRQRISINRFLSAMDADETVQYIEHRLKVVGACFSYCFEANCRGVLYKLTGGIPRLINQICDHALLICKAEGLEKINKRILKKADEALRSDLLFAPKFSGSLMKRFFGSPVALALTGVGFAVILGGSMVYMNMKQASPGPQVSVVPVRVAACLSANKPEKAPSDSPVTVPGPQGTIPDKELTPAPSVEDGSSLSLAEQKNTSSLTSAGLPAALPDPPPVPQTAPDVDGLCVGAELQKKSRMTLLNAETESKVPANTLSLSAPKALVQMSFDKPEITRESETVVTEQFCAVDAPNNNNAVLPDNNTEAPVLPRPLSGIVVVQEDENLSQIAYRYYRGRMAEGIDAILLANPKITNIDLVYAGQSLVMPEPVLHNQQPIQTFSATNLYYTVQVATISKSGKAFADKLVHQLNKKGYPAYFIEQHTETGGFIYKIRMGNFSTAAEADRMAMAYRKTEQKHSIVIESAIVPREQNMAGKE